MGVDPTHMTAATSLNIHSEQLAISRPKSAAANQRKRPASAAEQEGRKDDKRMKMTDLKASLVGSNFSQPDGLNPDLIGAKVTRWWAQSQSWFSGVITDYKPSKSQYCVTYDLGTNKESGELLNVDIAIGTGELKMLKESLDLGSYPHSRAVQSSTILNMWRKEMKKQMQEGGEVDPERRRNLIMEDSEDEE